MEANAVARPVIVLKAGGALDKVIEGVNGLFAEESRLESLVNGVKSFENGKLCFDPQKIRNHAMGFDKIVFKEKMKNFIARKYGEFQGKGKGKELMRTFFRLSLPSG